MSVLVIRPPEPATDPAPDARRAVRLVLAAAALAALATLLLAAPAGAADLDRFHSKAALLSNGTEQMAKFEIRVANDGGLDDEEIDAVFFTVPTNLGYTINNAITNRSSGPSGWVAERVVKSFPDGHPCEVTVPASSCDYIKFSKGTGSNLKLGDVHTFRVNLTTPATLTGSSTSFHTWRAVGCKDSEALADCDATVPLGSVRVEPVGISKVIIHSPNGAFDAATSGSQGTLSNCCEPGGKGQRVNFTVIVKNSTAQGQPLLEFKLRLKGTGSGDLQEESGTVNVPGVATGPSQRTFEFNPDSEGKLGYGFSYNFSSSTGFRDLNFSLVVSQPAGQGSAALEMPFTVVTKPGLVNTDTKLKFISGATCDVNVAGADNATISASTSTGPTKSTFLRVKYKNTGQAAAENIDPVLTIFDSNGDEVAPRLDNLAAAKFAISMQTPPGVDPLPSTKDDTICFKIETKPGVTLNGLYNTTVNLKYNDENTAVSKNNFGNAPMPACKGIGSCVPVIAESRFVNALTVDSDAPGVSVPTGGLPGIVNFERGGGAKRDVRVTVSDPNLDDKKVNLTLTRLPVGTEEKRVKLSRIAGTNDFNASIDFAQFEELNNITARVEAFDLAANKVLQAIGDVIVHDEGDPVLASGPTCVTVGGNVTLGQSVQCQVTVNDNFKMDPANVKLVPLHLNGTQEEAVDPEIFLEKLSVQPNSDNGTYVTPASTPFKPSVSGQYRIKVRAHDLAELIPGNTPQPHNVTFAQFYLLNVTSRLDLKVKPAGTAIASYNFPASKNVSQAHPVRFGSANASGTDNDPLIQMFNLASAPDTFQFRCGIAAGTTLQGTTACEVTNAITNVAGDDFGVNTPAAKANTVTVGVYKNDATLAAPFHPDGKELPAGETRLSVVMTVPPTARVGDVARINFTASSKFFPSASVTVRLGFEVSPAHDVRARAPGAPSAPVDLVRVDKAQPGRQFIAVMLVENLGNLADNFTISNTGPLTGEAANATVSETWDIRVESSDPRYNPATKTVGLGPNGASSLANQTTLRLVVTPPGDAAAGPSTAPVVRHLKLTATNATAGVASTGFLRINMVEPSVRVVGPETGTPTNGKLTEIFDSSNKALCPTNVAPAAVASCTFPHNLEAGGVTPPYVQAKFQVQVTSKLNVNPNDAFIVPPPALVLIAPDGSRERLPMTIVEADPLGDAVQGKNGRYQVTKNFTDTLGAYIFHFDVRDVSGDFLLTKNQTFSILEPSGTQPGAPGELGKLSNLVVSEGSTALARRSDSTFQANYGADIVVKVNLADKYMVGRATLKASQILDTGPVPAVPSEIEMVRTSTVSSNGTKVTNATFEATFRPALPASQGLGTYQFRIDAFDNQIASPAQPVDLTEIPFLVRLLDLKGPTFVLARMTGSGQTADDLDVEQNTTVLVEARVTDNGDATPGSNVNPDSVKVRVTRGTSVLVNNVTMTREANSATDYNFTLSTSLLSTVGTYAVQLCATDLGGAVTCVTRTLQVLVNLPPVITVTSPPLVDGQRFASSTTPVTVTITDANVDPNATGAIVVEVASGGGNFTTIQPTISGARPTLTLTIPISTDGNVTVRVTATDTLGLSNTTTFSVRNDNTAPVAAISVLGSEIGVKAFRPSAAEPFFVAPTTRLQVTATDTGSGVQAIVVSARPAGTGAPRNLTVTGAQNTFSLVDVFGTTPAPLDGDYLISARVTDRVGNAGTAPEVTVKLDSGPPTIGTIRPASPLSVTVTDLRSGVRSVEVEWSSTQDGPRETFALTAGAGGAFTGEFPPEASGTVFFLVKATDNVGNVAPEGRCNAQLCQLAFGNRAPVVTLSVTSEGQAVAAGGTVRGEVSIGWTARDPEEAQVLVSIKVGDAQGVEKTLVSDATLSPIAWDTTAEKDGAWTIRLEGSDGTLTNSTSLSVLVRNLRVAAEQPLPSNVNAGGSLVFAYEVTHPTKDIKGVVAVLRVGTQRENVTLFDDGTHGDRVANDGTWSATYTPRLRGQHTVDLAVTYEDDQQSTVANVGTFQAEGVAETVASLTFYAALVVGAAAAALGVFGLRRWP